MTSALALPMCFHRPMVNKVTLRSVTSMSGLLPREEQLQCRVATLENMYVYELKATLEFIRFWRSAI